MEVAAATRSSKELGGEDVAMEIDRGRERVLEGEEERPQKVSSDSCGADVPKPCLSRPGRQRNIRVFSSPGSLLSSGWSRLSGVENRSWLGLFQLTWP